MSRTDDQKETGSPMSRFLQKVRRADPRDILQVWKFPVAALLSVFYRRKHPDLWIVCEDRKEARDNGYWFFKYVRENHPEQECVYAICGDSPDFEKVRSLGDTVEFGSLKHWILYLASRKKISSQKAGNPNAAIFYFLEVYGLLRDNRIFLQHGIILNDVQWLYYRVTKMNRFICGAYPEYQFVKNRFGYPDAGVCYTGSCRFDGLHDYRTDKKMILIMPTWREWIADEDWRLKEYEGTTDFRETNYFKKWTEFLSDDKLKQIAEEYSVRFVFFPHRNMQKYLSLFPKVGDHVEIAGAGEYDVQYLLKTAAMMVTDYSSVFFDMVYMKKPVVFYQFDYSLFRKAQYGEGYFSYQNNPFGKSFSERRDVLYAIERQIKNGFSVSDEYIAAHQDFFPLYDEDNCKRVYDVVLHS